MIEDERVTLADDAYQNLSQLAVFLGGVLLQTHQFFLMLVGIGFKMFSAAPGRGIYDNMKTALDRVGPATERPEPYLEMPWLLV